MKTKKDALKKQEAEMLKQFNVEELEERLEMRVWFIGKRKSGNALHKPKYLN
jgi:hypothetical protein